jgi:hypothetical protein
MPDLESYPLQIDESSSEDEEVGNYSASDLMEDSSDHCMTVSNDYRC